MSQHPSPLNLLCKACATSLPVDSFDVLASYVSPDQYELSVGVTANKYMRKWIQCPFCTSIFSIYSRPPEAFNFLYDHLYRKHGSVPWRKLSTEETFKIVLELPPEKSETTIRVNSIKNTINGYINDGIIPDYDNYKLLDIGGSTGSFAYAFKSKEWKSYVIDPDESGNFISNYGVDFTKGYFNENSFGFKFNLVSLIFVLEHLIDPKELLLQIRPSLISSGLLYIEVPDAIAFEKNSHDHETFNSCHLWIFNPKTLSALLGDCGYELMQLNRYRTVRGYYALTALARPTNLL